MRIRICLVFFMAWLSIFAFANSPSWAGEDKAVKPGHHAGKHEPAESTASVSKVPYLVSKQMYPEPKQQPNYGPEYGSIRFIDTDPSKAIGGKLVMRRAVDENGDRIDEKAHGITMYMIHWGLEVGEPGTQDDKGAGDHGGDCRGFRDTGYVVMKAVDDLGDEDEIEWTLPSGTEVPTNAVYFVGHTLYEQIHNLGKCTQTLIENKN